MTFIAPRPYQFQRSYKHGILVFLGALLALCAFGQEPDLRIAGTLSTKPLLIDVVRAMKAEKGLQIEISTNFTSIDALDAVATGRVNIALITKEISGEDRSHYPEISLFTVPIGMEVVALGVSNDVWEAGVRTITKETMREIYEQKITNWQKAGGANAKIKLFTFQQGFGIWEIFADVALRG